MFDIRITGTDKLNPYEELIKVFLQPSEYRLNGDEAKAMVDVIRTRIKKIEFDTGSATFSITVTYGLAEYGFDGNAEAVVKEADNKLYIGKENGRDQIVF